MRHQAVPLVMILVVLTPRGAAAQSAGAPPTVSRAAELIARAEHQRTGPADRAALLEQASALLPDDDPRASGTLHVAGLTLYQLRQYRRALLLLEAAADLANERGSLSEAADTYLEAAFIAREINARLDAQRLLDRAYSVTTNSQMPEAERRRIRRRIESIGRVYAT
jgi:tetratricopeptide (TPR) repeat protein